MVVGIAPCAYVVRHGQPCQRRGGGQHARKARGGAVSQRVAVHAQLHQVGAEARRAVAAARERVREHLAAGVTERGRGKAQRAQRLARREPAGELRNAGGRGPRHAAHGASLQHERAAGRVRAAAGDAVAQDRLRRLLAQLALAQVDRLRFPRQRQLP